MAERLKKKYSFYTFFSRSRVIPPRLLVFCWRLLMEIIRGTTPTFIYTYHEADVDDMTSAYLTIKGGSTTIEKDLTEATVSSANNTLAWTLTQQESLSLGNVVRAMVNYKLADGTRGASEKTTFIVSENYKEGQI